MPTNFFASADTITVQLDDDHSVEIKCELDFGEENRLAGAAVQAGLDDEGKPKFEISLEHQRGLTLALYLVDWNLTGANGKTVPLPNNVAKRQELIGHLSPVWADKIMAKIYELRAAPVEAEATDAQES